MGVDLESIPFFSVVQIFNINIRSVWSSDVKAQKPPLFELLKHTFIRSVAPVSEVFGCASPHVLDVDMLIHTKVLISLHDHPCNMVKVLVQIKYPLLRISIPYIKVVLSVPVLVVIDFNDWQEIEIFQGKFIYAIRLSYGIGDHGVFNLVDITRLHLGY